MQEKQDKYTYRIGPRIETTCARVNSDRNLKSFFYTICFVFLGKKIVLWRQNTQSTQDFGVNRTGRERGEVGRQKEGKKDGEREGKKERAMTRQKEGRKEQAFVGKMDPSS